MATINYINIRRSQQSIDERDTSHKPPAWLLDKIADEKLAAGYNKRNRKCNVHNMKMSVTGVCMLCE